MQRVFTVGYFGSWAITAALLMFVSIALLWEMGHISSLTGVDDDITLLAMPMGATLGVWAAFRTRLAHAIHRAFSIAGVVCTLMGTLMAGRFLQSSERASGSGPFAGLGELVGVGMSLGVVAIGACMFGIWAFARLAHFDDGRGSHRTNQWQ